MIHMGEMAQLMDDDIIDDFNRCHGQPVIEGQMLVRAAASPLGVGFYNFNGFGFDLELLLIDRQTFQDDSFTAGKIKLLQIASQLFLAPAPVSMSSFRAWYVPR